MKRFFLLLLAVLCGLMTTHGLTMRSGGHQSAVDMFRFVYEDDNTEMDQSSLVSYGLDPGPPPYKEYARMARYIVHNTDWCSVATISSRFPTTGQPFASVLSHSDGASLDKSSGVLYFYVTQLEMTVQDIEKDNHISVILSLIQSAFCRSQEYDPQDPRCAQLMMNGKMIKLEEGSEEEAFAKEALFTKHPVMASWPSGHHFFFMKMEITYIALQDFFGGPAIIELKDYFSATPY